MKNYFAFLLIFIFNLSIIGQSWNSIFHFSNNNHFRVHKVLTDEIGNVYVSGVFMETYSTYTSHGDYDIFLAKISPNKQLLWFKQIGGEYIDFGLDIAYKNNTVFLVAGLQDNAVISDNDTITLDDLSRDVAFLKFSSNGTLLLKNKLAYGNSNVVPQSIAIDRNDSLLICGSYVDEINIGSYYFSKPGTHNFIAKTDFDGNVSWVKNITGNNSSSRIIDIKAYDDGYYFSGYFSDSLYLDIKNLKSSFANKSDLLIYKTDINGKGLWVRRSYGSGNDVCGSVTGDDYGNVYYTGYFQSSSLTTDSTGTLLSTQTLVRKGDFDIFIFKYNKNGVLQWAKNYGSPYREYAVDICERNDFLYISGYYTNQLIFGKDILTSNGITDRNIFIGTFDLKGNMVKGDHIKGNDQGEDISNGLWVDNNNNVFLAGYFKSSVLYVGEDQLTNNFTSTYDGLVAKYGPSYSAVFTTVENPKCNSVNNGMLRVTPYFGVPPYTFNWSHAPHSGINGATASDLAPGTYTVEVIDSRDSVAVATITLTQPSGLLTSVIITNPSCYNYNNGAINLSVSGGTGDYDILWTSPDGSGIDPDAEDQSGLNRGTYYVTVKDENLCEAKDTFILVQPGRITFSGSVVTDVEHPVPGAGHYGSVNLSVHGGTPTYTFDWSNGATTEDIGNLLGGTYSIEVTDLNGCFGDTAFNVKNDTMLIAYFSDKKDITCNGKNNGSATVTALNGQAPYDYIWSDGFTWNDYPDNFLTRTPINPGVYIVTVIDANNKVSRDTVTITQPSALSPMFDVKNLTCFNDNSGIIDLKVNGGTLPYSFEWSNNARTEDIENIQASASGYIVKVIDSNGCDTTSNPVIVTEPATISFVVDADPLIKNYCYGDAKASAHITNLTGGSGALSILWDDPGAQVTSTATYLRAGIYHVTVTDINGCFKNNEITITEPPAIVVDNVTFTQPLCYGDSNGEIFPQIEGGTPPYVYTWNNGTHNPYLSDVPAGNYILKIMDGCSCVDSFPFILNQPQPLTYNSVTKTDVMCFDYSTGEINIFAQGGTGSYQYSAGGTWQNQPVFTNLHAANYVLRVRDANLCVTPDSIVTVTQPDGIDFSSQVTENVSCHGSHDGSITITVNQPGDYEYSINNGLNYYDNNGSFENVSPGQYHVKVSDGTCEYQGNTLTVIEPLAVSVSEVTDNISCAGKTNGRIEIFATGGTGAYIYSINDGINFYPQSTFTSLGEGFYNILVRDQNDCEVAGSTITMIEPEEILVDTVSVTHVTAINNGAVVAENTGGISPLTYIIKQGADSITSANGQFTLLTSGDCQLYLVDNNSCFSDTITFEINDINSTSGLILYDAFSPFSTQGLNDTWNIGNIQQYPDCKVKIYNSWGTLVFSSGGYSEPWDGKYNGKELPAGTYYYVIDPGDGSGVLSGSVNIVN